MKLQIILLEKKLSNGLRIIYVRFGRFVSEAHNDWRRITEITNRCRGPQISKYVSWSAYYYIVWIISFYSNVCRKIYAYRTKNRRFSSIKIILDCANSDYSFGILDLICNYWNVK